MTSLDLSLSLFRVSVPLLKQFFDEDENEVPPTRFESVEMLSGDFVVTFTRPGLYMARSTALPADTICVIEVADGAEDTAPATFFPDLSDYVCPNMPVHLACATPGSKVGGRCVPLQTNNNRKKRTAFKRRLASSFSPSVVGTTRPRP